MAQSMTGFGRATGALDGERVSIELSGVNHRYFECSFRLPFAWTPLEPVLRETLRGRISRGKITVNVRRQQGLMGRRTVVFDPEAARGYLEASRQLAAMMHTGEALSLNTLAGLDGVFCQEEAEEDLEHVREGLTPILDAALDQYNAMRAVEGAALARDIAERIARMREALKAIAARVPELAAAYEARLRERVAALNAEAGISEDRLALEVALMADKSDIHEEVVRLEAHLDHASALLESDEPIGRELNFLAQEIQREATTLTSKLRDIGVAREAMKIKLELEKLREQAQNIE